MAYFYLENENKERVDLQELDNCLAENVTNLGYDTSSAFVQVGDHFIQNYLNPKQSTLSMNLNFFRPNIYDKVQKVGNFIATAKQLYLAYKPQTTKGIEYKREVTVSSYLKTSTKKGYITYALKLNPTTLFYAEDATIFQVEKGDGEKRYDFTWDARYNDYSLRYCEIEEGNHVEVAFEMKIEGYTENPKLEILANNGEEWSITFPVTLQQGEYIRYSSLDSNLVIEFVNEIGEVRNMFSEFSLEDTLFYKIPKEGAMVRFTSDTDVMNTITFTAYVFYKVV
ncbi:MAG: hypothetical protein R3Y54_13000 [Eubacteriales bacterium]